MSARRDSEAGFTLIELIVSLGISALIATLLFGGYHFVSRAWLASARTADGANDVYAVQQVIRRAVNGIPTAVNRAGFRGSLAELQFNTLFALPGTLPRPMTVSLYEQSCKEGDCLMLMLKAAGADGDDGVKIGHDLIRGIASVRFSYKGRGDSNGWQSTWDPAAGTPRLVRIDVGFGNGMVRRWPPLYIAPPGQD